MCRILDIHPTPSLKERGKGQGYLKSVYQLLKATGTLRFRPRPKESCRRRSDSNLEVTAAKYITYVLYHRGLRASPDNPSLRAYDSETFPSLFKTK